MIKRLLVLAVTGWSVAACGPQLVVLDPSNALAPTCAKGIKVYAEQGSVPQNYREVAVITGVRSQAGLDEMRQAAAKSGATAIVLGAARTAPLYKGTSIGPADQDALAIFVASDTAAVNGACAISSLDIAGLRQRIGWQVKFDYPWRQFINGWDTQAILDSVSADSIYLRKGSSRRGVATRDILNYKAASSGFGKPYLALEVRRP